MAIKINIKKNKAFCNDNVCYLVPFHTSFQFPQKSWYPPTDVCISNENIYIIASVPGVEVNDITITYSQDTFIIHGYRKFPLSENENNIFYQKEIGYGEFEKKLTLPFLIDANTIEANLKNGLLIIKAKKIQKKESVKINIR